MKLMMDAGQVCTLKDWAALINSIIWPAIVLFILVFFRSTLATWVSSVTDAELMGVKLSRLAENTKTTTQALLESDSDFARIEDLLDWNKVAESVRKWATEHKAPNPSDMGINNFRRFLFEAGLPGGREVELEWEPNGMLKYQ